MIEVQELISNQLSYFRTNHVFRYYGEFTTAEEFIEYCQWAMVHNTKVYILGNGSNTLFTHSTVKSLVLKNKLKRHIERLDAHRFTISSSVHIMEVLKFCRNNNLDSFYYLASVPATIGGAIAMNAGRGPTWNSSIFDFLESITWVEESKIVSAPATQIAHSYRNTPFTGIHQKLIVSGTFYFPELEVRDDKIRERINLTLEDQDNSSPNCGTVFSDAHGGIMRRMRGLWIGGARYSPKTTNWILNTGTSPYPIRVLIWIGKILHRLLGKRIKVEIIEVP